MYTLLVVQNNKFYKPINIEKSTQINQSLDFFVSNFYLKLSFLMLYIYYNLMSKIMKIHYRNFKSLFQGNMASLYFQHIRISKTQALEGLNNIKSLFLG